MSADIPLLVPGRAPSGAPATIIRTPMALGSRTAILRRLIARNGLRWLAAFATAEVLRRTTRALDRLTESIERKHGLPGFFGAETQRLIWDTYDWSQHGEEWTGSEAWKRSVVERLLQPHLGRDRDVLEIGPGAGRWTVELQPLARTLALADVSATCIALCKERFRSAHNVRYAVNDGRTLPFEAASFDRVWSFDVFVHIGREDIASYLGDLFRVLRPNGLAMIHHTADGGIRGHWRSKMTADLFGELARAAGLTVLRQFDTWTAEDGQSYDVRGSGDAITLLERPQ